MADRNLIQGAAALAQADGNMSRAFGAGLAQEATRIADDIIKKENERIAQVKNDMNLAAQFIGKMASTGSAAGQYKNILTSEGMNVKNKLNEIALDPSLNPVEKAAAYTKAVDEYNVLASTYASDQEKLVALQGVVRAGSYSNTIDRDTEEFGIARSLGTGDYEIIKDGYLVNGKKITSAELDQYVQLYKPKNIEAFSKLDIDLRNSITNAKGRKDIEKTVVNTANSIPVDQKLNYLVDYKGQAYNNFFQDGKINEDLVETAYSTEINKIRNESSVQPVIETKTIAGSDTFQSVFNTTNRYISQNNLGEQMVNSGVEISGRDVIKATEPDTNGNMIVSVQFSMKDGNPRVKELTLNINNPDQRYLIDKAFAEQSFSGKSLQDFNTFYLNNISNLFTQQKIEEEINMDDFESNLIGGVEDTLQDIKETKAKKDAFDIGLGKKTNIKPELNIRERSTIPPVRRTKN
tara:strand:- start:618 stop:2009 length:1392 start_codon:yes stop_codon:yes gene_type:complete